jgi:hypothetical protein
VQIDKAAQEGALERLDAFVGEWAMEPSGSVRTKFEWVLERRFLSQRFDVPNPEAPDMFALIGLDAHGSAYLQHYFDSRGVVRLYEMSFTDGVWKLFRESPGFSQRFNGTFSGDGKLIEGSWERSKDGSTWEHDFDLTYTKVE